MERKFLQLRLTPEQYSAISFAAWQNRQSLSGFAVSLLETYCRATGIYDKLAEQDEAAGKEPAAAPVYIP